MPLGLKNCAAVPTPSAEPIVPPPTVVTARRRDLPDGLIVGIRHEQVATGVCNAVWLVEPRGLSSAVRAAALECGPG